MASGPPSAARAGTARACVPAGLSPLPRRVASGLAGLGAASRRGSPASRGSQRPAPRSGLVLPGPAALARLGAPRGGTAGPSSAASAASAASATRGPGGLSTALPVGHVGLTVVRGGELGAGARPGSRCAGGSPRGAPPGVARGLGSRRGALRADTARGEAPRAAAPAREETELDAGTRGEDGSVGDAARLLARGGAGEAFSSPAPARPARELLASPRSPAGELGSPPPPAGELGSPPPPAGELGSPPPPAGELGSPPPPAGELGSPPPPAGELGPPPPPAGELSPSPPPALFRPSATPRARRPFPAWVAALRAALFFTWLYSWSLPLLAVMVLAYPWVKRSDPQRRTFMHAVNALWARISLWPFVRLEIRREEEEDGEGAGTDVSRKALNSGGLPPKTVPSSGSSPSKMAPIYVANHCSALDILSLLIAVPGFKFVARSATFRVPVLGWAMRLTGHVRLRRSDSRSHAKALRTCRELLAVGAPVLFFPEGTRTRDGRLDAFKDGAFVAAAKAKAPIVPITLTNTGGVMPPRKEWLLWPGTVHVTVHRPIETAGKNAREIRDEARRVIADEIDRIARRRQEEEEEKEE